MPLQDDTWTYPYCAMEKVKTSEDFAMVIKLTFHMSYKKIIWIKAHLCVTNICQGGHSPLHWTISCLNSQKQGFTALNLPLNYSHKIISMKFPR